MFIFLFNPVGNVANEYSWYTSLCYLFSCCYTPPWRDCSCTSYRSQRPPTGHPFSSLGHWYHGMVIDGSAPASSRATISLMESHVIIRNRLLRKIKLLCEIPLVLSRIFLTHNVTELFRRNWLTTGFCGAVKKYPHIKRSQVTTKTEFCGDFSGYQPVTRSWRRPKTQFGLTLFACSVSCEQLTVCLRSLIGQKLVI